MEEQSVEDIYRHLWEQDEKAKEVNRSFVFRKKDFLIMVGGFLLAILSIVFLFIEARTSNHQYEQLSLACLGLSLLFMQGPAVLVIIKSLKRPVRSTFEAIAEASGSDYDLAQELAKFEYSELKHVQARIEMEKGAVDAKLGMIFGNIRKIGWLPTALTVVATFHTLAQEDSSFPWIKAAAIVTTIYALSGLIYAICFRIDRCLVTLDSAIRVKDEKAHAASS
ncbi:hypothetical protein [Salinivibrio sp. VYel1]|uniref:hypothetical protein n=1 Tax=Salinivibrio sp. VYel1 TaxID=2490490 RepID=UPI00128C48E7|nr:hypothetical protein [Salinivibrio sp. VYel1]MPX91413.1 hypothetical protein [Salinivibrio sp. VYel1]